MNGIRETVDPPSALDILQLVEAFLDVELAPAQADAKLRFRTKVAANLLRITRREFEHAAGLKVDRDGYAVPPELLTAAGSLQNLADDLAHGRRRLTEPETFALVMRQVESKLAIASPETLTESPTSGET